MPSDSTDILSFPFPLNTAVYIFSLVERKILEPLAVWSKDHAVVGSLEGPARPDTGNVSSKAFAVPSKAPI